MAISSGLVTVVSCGGLWCAVKINGNEKKQFLTNPLIDKISAIAAAQSFAKENSLPFKENALTYNRPFLTVWHAYGYWVPAKIFETHIQLEGPTLESTSEALERAKQLAIKEELEFFPSIGQSIFK